MFNEILSSRGLLSVQAFAQDTGRITCNNVFKLSNDQKEILRAVSGPNPPKDLINSLMNSANSNSYFFLPSSSSSKTFFLNFAFGLLPNGMNDINVRYVRKMSEKCQKCQWVYTSVRVCTSVRCFVQLCPGVSK